jgi:hypothetical protein
MADKTAVFESTQALFCAIADYVGKGSVSKVFDLTKFTTYKEFKQKNKLENVIRTAANRYVTTPGVSLQDMENLLTSENSWYQSSVLIAKKLIEDITSIDTDFKNIQAPKWSDVFYTRGDKDIMGNIGELFKIANVNAKKEYTKSISFSNINKWSPADMYFASNDAKIQIAKEVTKSKANTRAYSFMELNDFIAKLIDKGDLLPLSLKKTTTSVVLDKVNFDRSAEDNKLKNFQFVKTSDWKPYAINKPQTRDLQIFFVPGSRDVIKFRHDPSTPAFKGEFISPKNPEARGGSLGDGPLGDIFGIYDKAFGSSFTTNFKKADKDFKERVKKLGTKPTDKKLKAEYDEQRAQLSALYVTNKIFPPVIKWLNADKKRATAFVKTTFQYVTSRSVTSSRFVIAKGG